MKTFKKIMLTMLVAGISSSVTFGAVVVDPENTIITSRVLCCDEGVVASASFNHASTRIVTASGDNTARVWDLDGNCLTELRGHKDVVFSASFNPTGDRIVTASWDKTAKVWDLYGNCLTMLRGHTKAVNSASFNPTGNRIVTASWDSTVKVWDLDGNCLVTLKEYDCCMRSASFNPTGNRIVTASWDSIAGDTAKVWDLAGTCLVTLRGHKGPVNSARFNVAGDHIVTASRDGTVRLWEDTRFTRAKAELKNEIFHFLLAQHIRCGANSPAHNLTQHVIQCIFDCYGLRPFDAIQ